MANRETGTITLIVEGRAHRLRMTMDAMCQLEDAIAKNGVEMSFFKWLPRLQNSRMTEVRLFIWASMLDGQPDATLKDASALIDAAGGPMAIFAQINALQETAHPDTADVEALGAAHPPTARRGAGGRRSSKRGAPASVETSSGVSPSESSSGNSSRVATARSIGSSGTSH